MLLLLHHLRLSEFFSINMSVHIIKEISGLKCISLVANANYDLKNYPQENS